MDAPDQMTWLPGDGGPLVGVLYPLLRAGSGQLVGRRVTLGSGAATTSMTVAELDAGFGAVGLAFGQLDRVRLVGRDVLWTDTPLQQITVHAERLRLRPAPLPTLSTGPLEMEITVPGSVVSQRIARARPDVHVEIGRDAVARVTFTRYRRWGHVEVHPALVDNSLVLTPRALNLGSWQTAWVSRLPAVTIRLPTLPRGLQLTGLTLGPSTLVLRARAQDWHGSLAPAHLPGLVRAVATAGAQLIVPPLIRP